MNRPRQTPTIQHSIRLSEAQTIAAEEAAAALGMSTYRFIISAIETMIGVHEGKWTIEVNPGYDADAAELELEPRS